MGNGISVTATTGPGASPVGLNPQQQQELRQAIEEASDEHLSEILQFLEDEGLSMNSPNAHERSVASVRALQLLRPGVVIVPLPPIPQFVGGAPGGGGGAHPHPLPFPFFGLGTQQPPPPLNPQQDEIDDDEDPYAGMPPLAGSAEDTHDPYEGMPALITSTAANGGGGGEASTASLSTSPEQATPTLFSQFQQSQSTTEGGNNSDGSSDDEDMPALVQPTNSAANNPSPSPPSSDDSDDEFAGMPPLLPITPSTQQPTTSTPSAPAAVDAGYDSDDSNSSMPPLADVRPYTSKANKSNPPPPINNLNDSDSDSDSMPDLVEPNSTARSLLPKVKPPSALDTFTFSSAFPSLLLSNRSQQLQIDSSAFPLPPLPPPEESPLRRSLTSLPVDILHAIGWFLLESAGKDGVYGFEKPKKCSIEVVRLSTTCRAFYGVLRREMYKYLEIRGDDQTKARLEWIKRNDEVASWVRYVKVATLCPLHRDLIAPIAEAVATFSNLTHFAWLAHSSIPPTIASALVKSSNLTSLNLWRNAIGAAYLLHGLNLVELKISRSVLGDGQCDEMIDAGTGPLQGGTFEENAVVYAMRDKRDLSAFRGLIAAYHGTLERICFEPEFRSGAWMETVLGAHPPDPPTPPLTPPVFAPPPTTVLPLLALPRLRTIRFPTADLTSPTFHHLLETSPQLESLFITHLPVEEGNEISPTAPEGTLQNLTTLHYRGGRRDGQRESFPIKEGLESFLSAGDATRVRNLEVSNITPVELQSILLSANFTALKTLAISITSLTRPMLQIIVRECRNLEDLTIDAFKWQITLPVFSALLRPLRNLTRLTLDHSVALTTQRSPIPQAQDLLFNGTYPSEVADKIERYLKSNTTRWTKNFVIFAEENYKLEQICWQASDEVLFEFTVVPGPPFSAEELERAQNATALPMHPLIKRRNVKLEPETRIELGAFDPHALEGFIGGLAGLQGEGALGVLMAMLGIPANAPAGLAGGLGAEAVQIPIPANLFGAGVPLGPLGGPGGGEGIPGLGAFGGFFPVGGFGVGVAGAGAPGGAGAEGGGAGAGAGGV